MPSEPDDRNRTVTFSLGQAELVIRQKYEVTSIINDLMVAAWFVAGSILFFFGSTTTLGTWMFLLGSIQLAIRPIIRLARRIHLRRFRAGSPGETSWDF